MDKCIFQKHHHKRDCFPEKRQ